MAEQGIAGTFLDYANSALGNPVGKVIHGSTATSDVVKEGGITAAVSLMKAFPGLQSVDTPEGMLHTLETKLLPSMPESVPAGHVYNLLDSLHLPDKAKADALAILDPKLKDDGKLTRPEMLQAMADIGNKIDSVEPAASIKQQAAGVLERQHIDDPTGQIAIGLAKLAVTGAIGVQKIEDGASPASEVRELLQPRPATPGPAPD